MATETDIANMALGHLKQTKRIGNLRTEKSQEAMICLTYYDTANQEVQRDFDWPFATQIGALQLVAQSPNAEWGFAYRYPSGCINFRKIQSGYRVPTTDSAVAFRIAADDQGLLVFTDMPNAIGEWTGVVTNTAFFHPDFTMALSLKIASYIAPALTGSDPYKLGDKAESRYQQAILKASINAANEQKRDRPTEADSITARDGYTTHPGFPRAF